jgi:anti-anti-sigma regulatory factor
MECRIQVLEQRDTRIVAVAGQLTAAHIADLLVACGEISSALHIDLTDVIFTDPIAVDALRRLRDGGAQLVGVPGYIQLKLDSFRHTPRGL